MNFLEQLVAEWYEYKGHYVRTNIKFGKRPRGGYEGEIDIAAFEPRERKIVHLEASMDALPWDKREKRFTKKFNDAAKHYNEIFDFDYERVEQIVIVGFGKAPNHDRFNGDIKVRRVPDLVEEIIAELKSKNPMQAVVPESYPLLRAMQFAAAYGLG